VAQGIERILSPFGHSSNPSGSTNQQVNAYSMPPFFRRK